jgi:hypothetical protein
LLSRPGKKDLTVTLNFDTGRLSLKDNLTGESSAATPGQPLRNEGSSILLDAHSETVSLAVVAFEENLTNLGIPRSSPGRRSGAAPPLLFSMQPAQPGSRGEGKSLILKDSPGNCSGVIGASIAGWVQPAAGEALSHECLAKLSPSEATASTPALSSTVQAEGFFQRTGVAPGSYVLEVDQPGFRSAKLPVNVLPGSATYLRGIFVLSREPGPP